MRLPRRQFLQLAAGAAVLPAASRIASAQAYPARPVRLVVPYTAGAASDAVARLIANRLSEIWGQQVFVENRGGANGNIAAQAVIQSAPDGYTLFFGSVFLATNPFFYASLGYDPIADFAPVSLLCVFPNMMVVPNSLPAKSVKEFVDYAKSNRGKITFASTGAGSSVHLSGELFKRMAGIEMTHVPYRGGAPALNDVIPGRIDVYFGNLPGMLPQVRNGTLRGIAVTSATRSPLAPEIPTIHESGLPGFDVAAWFGIFVRANTPAEIVSKINTDVVAALANLQVKQKLEAVGATVTPSTPIELASHLKAETAKWGPIIKESGMKLE